MDAIVIRRLRILILSLLFKVAISVRMEQMRRCLIVFFYLMGQSYLNFYLNEIYVTSHVRLSWV